ncbi:hypothetical protein [Parasitella parasitica]|uniref:Uncharacterized protein n=1 Tax=Parasitella parasitica TaxID=35722 RepID=A0A0B7NNF3_9FUNG|nr:hypothetical protein [Parasitella parasitica]
MTIKGSLNTIEFQKHYRKALEQFVLIFNDITRDVYILLNFFFLHKFCNSQFDALQCHFNWAFFQEVWLSLIARSQHGGYPPGQETRARRAKIAVHFEDYLNASVYQLPAFKYVQQTAIYEAEKMYTAYIVSIKETFRNQLRCVVHLLLKVQERSKTSRLQAKLHKSTTSVHTTNQQLKTRTYQEITEPAKLFKETLSSGSDSEILPATLAPEGGVYLRTIER